MSEQENLQLVQRAYKAFAQRDLAAVLSLVTDEVDWKFDGPKVSFTEPKHGRTRVEQAFRSLLEQIRLEAFQQDEFIVGRDSVVVLGHERGGVRATGRVVEAQWVRVFDLRDGLVWRFREYNDTAAWNAGFDATDDPRLKGN